MTLSKEAIDVLLATLAKEWDAKIKHCTAALRELVLAGLLELQRGELPSLTAKGRRRAEIEERKLQAVPIGGAT